MPTPLLKTKQSSTYNLVILFVSLTIAGLLYWFELISERYVLLIAIASLGSLFIKRKATFFEDKVMLSPWTKPYGYSVVKKELNYQDLESYSIELKHYGMSSLKLKSKSGETEEVLVDKSDVEKIKGLFKIASVAEGWVS